MDFCLLILIAVAVWFLKMTYFLPWRHVGIPGLIAGTHCRASRTPAGGVAGGCGGSVGRLAATEGAICVTPGGWPLDPEVCFSDVWSFDPENLRWTQKFGSWMLRFFGEWGSIWTECSYHVLHYCYMLKFDFLLRFHIISSKLTRFKRKSCLLFVPGLQTQGHGRRDKACFSIWINWVFSMRLAFGACTRQATALPLWVAVCLCLVVAR